MPVEQRLHGRNNGLLGDVQRDNAENTRGPFQCQTAGAAGARVALLFQRSPGRV
jgi:hypothetical protein